MKKEFNLFHPYSLAVIVAIVGFGTLIYIGLTAPTEKDSQEVKGATTESELSYSKNLLREYGTDLEIKDQSGLFEDVFLDQQNVEFVAYSGANVTYDLFKITNKTDQRITLRITPKKVTNPNMDEMAVNMLIDGGNFELYSYSTTPNKDYFAISLDPFESYDLKLSITTNNVDTETIRGEIIFQIVEM